MAHIGLFKTTLFGKTGIFDVARLCLGLFQIFFGCKSAVKADLERITAMDFFLRVQHRNGRTHIGGIAFDNQTVTEKYAFFTEQVVKALDGLKRQKRYMKFVDITYNFNMQD